MIDYYGKKMPVFKANLHSHTTHSDGKFSPDELISRYAQNGYQVLAITDHWKSNKVSTYNGHGMTLISGAELHPQGPRNITWHLLMLGVPEDMPDLHGKNAEEIIGNVRSNGGICFVAHPYWSGLNSTEIATLKDVSGIEVWNSDCRYIGKGYNMQIWDELLDAYGHYGALANDDTHIPGDMFKGWTMIIADDASPASLLSALSKGQFYSSQGPEIKRISYQNGIFEAEFSPCCEAILMSSRWTGYCEWTPDKAGPGSPPRELTSLRQDLTQDKTLSERVYLRLQIRDTQGRYAWSMPIML